MLKNRLTFNLQCPVCDRPLKAVTDLAGQPERPSPVQELLRQDPSADAVLRAHIAMYHSEMVGEPDAPAEASEPTFANAGGRDTYLYHAAARMFGWTVQQVDATDEHVLRALLRLAHLRDEDDDGASGQPAVPPDPDDSGPTITVHVHSAAITERQLRDAVRDGFLRLGNRGSAAYWPR